MAGYFDFLADRLGDGAASLPVHTGSTPAPGATQGERVPIVPGLARLRTAVDSGTTITNLYDFIFMIIISSKQNSHHSARKDAPTIQILAKRVFPPFDRI